MGANLARNLTDELRDAGPTVSLPVAIEAVGISRSAGYSLAKRGAFPVTVLRVGGTYRVIARELRELLGIEHHAQGAAPEAQ